MSLYVRLLEKARELGNGLVQARCPACAESGQDKKGEHLRVYPDGRFGCCVHPKDRAHRQRIFALAGDKKVRTFSVKVTGVKTATAPAKSVASSLTNFRGTLGTPLFYPRAYTREEEPIRCDDTHTYKDFESGVPSVPNPLTPVRQPHLTPGGTLVIPFESDARFHWWNGGQALQKTIEAVKHKFRNAEGKEHNGIGV